MVEARQSFWRRRPWAKWVAGGLLVVLAVLGVAVDLALRRAEPFLRDRIVQVLAERFHTRVELDTFHVSLVNGLRAEGKGLRIWPPAVQPGTESPSLAERDEPMISLKEFSFHAPLRFKPGKPIHISLVELKGLTMHVPPRGRFQQQLPGAAKSGKPAAIAGLVSFEVDRVECIGADLVMETSKPGKLPLEFPIAWLKVNNVNSGGAMNFEAELTNPRPRGSIHTSGTLGPWPKAGADEGQQAGNSVSGDTGQPTQRPGPVLGDPGELPISGDYHFDHADLSTFKGIAGTLASTGRFQGTLRGLTVDGDAQVPDFRLTHFGSAVNLTTHFHAQVDGTDGDTWLEPVHAVLGRSQFTAQGQIVRVPIVVDGGVKREGGHDIALTVTVDKARIEDFLRLTSRTGAVLMNGDVTVKAALHIPPGAAPVYERVNLNGRFVLSNARFTSSKIQGRIADLSLRGQGRPDAIKTTDPASIPAEMQSGFQVARGVVTLPAIDFKVPGADIQLKGTYGIDGGALSFAGTAKMDATVSQMVGGWKGFLLKPADRFLKKDGAGTEVPIHIEGTREDPRFGVDFDRMKPSAHKTEQPKTEQQ